MARCGSTSAGLRAAGACLAAALLAGGPPAADAAPASEVQALQAAPCPERYDNVFASSYSPAEQEAALAGDFDVLLGRGASITVPVDWAMDPYDSRSWRHWLHTLGWWMDSLFYIYREGGPSAALALAQARDLALDWIAANPPASADQFNPPWSRKVTADRAAYLAYLARAAACEGMLSDEQAATMIDSLRAHGEFLVANHTAGDHGLYADYALGLLDMYLPFLPEADGWRALAIERFGPTLRRRFDAREGVWLVNTPVYQATVADLTDRWLEDVHADPGLARLAARMRNGVGWFVLPDGELAPFGDHHTMVPVPAWVPSVGEGRFGLRAMRRSGYAVVRQERRYLGVTASYFFPPHKQADELSFELFDRGRRLITDTGHYDYEYDRPWYQFQRSAPAHSTLTVDGEDFPIDEPGSQYGSGIRAAGRGAGWYAIAGVNPLLRRQGVRHRRLFLYRPGRALYVVDTLRSGETHAYQRHFQIGPGLDAAPRARGVILADGGFRARLRDVGGSLTRVSIVRGQSEPLAGWSFPDYRTRVPRWTATLHSRGRNEDYLTVLDLDGRGASGVRLLRASARTSRLRLDRGRRAGMLTVVQRGHRLAISAAR